MIGIQLIAVTFALIAFFFSYIHYRKRDFSGKELFVWGLVWLGFLLVSLFPEWISPYVQKLGFSRLMDFVVMVAFVILFVVILHNYLVVHRLEKRIEELVRKLALKDTDKS